MQVCQSDRFTFTPWTQTLWWILSPGQHWWRENLKSKMFARCVGWKTTNKKCSFKSFENNVKSNSFSAPNCVNIYTSPFINLPVAAKCSVTTSFNRYQLQENKYFACSFQFNAQIWLMYKLIKQHFFCKVWHSVGVCYRKFPVHLFTCRLIFIVIKAET